MCKENDVEAPLTVLEYSLNMVTQAIEKNRAYLPANTNTTHELTGLPKQQVIEYAVKNTLIIHSKAGKKWCRFLYGPDSRFTIILTSVY
jgi:hypothetical protein